MRTYQPNSATIERNWLVIDAEGLVLGRLATEVAHLLRGKHKPTWAPHVDTGDNIIVVNAAKIDVSPKRAQEPYHRHTGYPGGLRTTTLANILATKPERAIEIAVRGMLPKGRLGRQMIKKLHVYGGATHPHIAQAPVTHVIASRKSA
jgi:large subunit ribosomal protein L13